MLFIPIHKSNNEEVYMNFCTKVLCIYYYLFKIFKSQLYPIIVSVIENKWGKIFQSHNYHLQKGKVDKVIIFLCYVIISNNKWSK